MAQSNSLPCAKIVEDAAIRIEEYTKMKGFCDGTNGEEISGKASDIKDIMEMHGGGGMSNS